jgi:hypothetical protein
MSNKECGKLKDYTNTKYLYTLAENTPKVIYVQKRKLGKDKTHSRIRLESNRISNTIHLNCFQNSFEFLLDFVWNTFGIQMDSV